MFYLVVLIAFPVNIVKNLMLFSRCNNSMFYLVVSVAFPVNIVKNKINVVFKL